MKRIGILTSGGDCAGLNAAIRAAVFRAIRSYNWEVIGIQEGTHGLLERPVKAIELDTTMFNGTIMRQGGTILGTTNQKDPFSYPMPDGSLKDRSGEVIEGYRILGLDALIGIGGDGSLAILRRLAQLGNFCLVGIPKTIDNDVNGTDISIGYDTAVEVATEALDRLQPTAASHARVMVLEVMGRDAGHIALAAGIAGGADIILVPEIPYNFETIVNRIHNDRKQGRNFTLMIVSEAVKTIEGTQVQKEYQQQRRYGGIGVYMSEKIAQETGAETRVTVLGHVQRGSIPSPLDRIIAAAFGVFSVDVIAQGRDDRMVAWVNRQVVDIPLRQVIDKDNRVEPDSVFLKTARALGICLGDE